MVADHDILIAIFTGILKSLEHFHRNVSRDGCTTKFLCHLCRTILGVPFTYVSLECRLASWGAADMARAWHRDEWFTQGDAWYFLHERLTQRVKNPIQHVGLRQCAPAQMRCSNLHKRFVAVLFRSE